MTCPHCHSADVEKVGHIYYCNCCSKSFKA